MSEGLCVGFVRPKHVSGLFMESLVTLALARKMTDGWLGLQSGPRIAAARNEIVDHFLDMKTADYLLMVDTDMDFEVETVDRLMAAADQDTILGGLCFTDNDQISPTMYRLIRVDGQMAQEVIWNYPPDALCEVDATGAAFLLIPRKVLAAMRDHFKGRTAFPYFAESEVDLFSLGEDITFCLRARGLGFRVVVDTGAHVGHLKERVVTQDTYLQSRREYTEANQ